MWKFTFLLLPTIVFSLEFQEIDLELIKKGWSYKGNRSYYALQINDTFLKGDRPWEHRWNLIKDAFPYENAKVLELGANTSILSIFLTKFFNAKCTAVDRPSRHFCKESSELLQKGFGVNFEFLEFDLDTDQYEAGLGYDYDIVFCMSLLYWVTDKQRLLTYLSHFNHVLFEGHDYPPYEISQFQKHGFNKHQILGISDNGRTLILFSK